MENLHPGEGLVERWISEIRRRIPKGSSLTATLQTKAQRGFLVSFRLRMADEEVSSEARAESMEEAVVRAGRGLCEHLPAQITEEILAREELFARAS